MAKHFMNPQHGRHMGGEEEQPAVGEKPGEGGQEKPHIHIHSHSGGHTVHILHHDGRHEKHEHEAGDADGVAQHVHQQLGDGAGSYEHGYSPSEEEDEPGYGHGV